MSNYTWSKPKPVPTPATSIVVESPNRSAVGPCESVNGYCFYTTGVGGACAGPNGYEPPSGYWCNTHPPRGTSYTTAWPSALTVDAHAFDGRTWWNGTNGTASSSWRPNETVVNAFREGHW